MTDVTHSYYRKDIATAILADIDAYALKTWDNGFRTHLGASLIGQECTRKTWYSWRWMAINNHNGRMQRLWQRGHREEPAYINYLRGIGAEVWEADPNTGKQFQVSRLGGHFGGSLDGIARLPPKYNVPFPVLTEFKTKGTGKGFTELREKGVMLANPQHFDQMSTYGANYQLEYALYMSTNKNDDDMHVELVKLDWKRAGEVEQKAAYIIGQQTPPPRISLNPTFWMCKSCQFHGVCHDNHMPVKNCRSCQYASPVDGGMWYCNGHKAVIPSEVIPKGCPHWAAILSPPGA